MITAPSVPQMIRVVRRDLVEHVLGAVTDPGVRSEIEMMVVVLEAAASRAAAEPAVLEEEAREIRAVAETVLERTDVPTLAAAIAAYDRALGVEDEGERRYNLAGEVLSCAAEAALAAQDVELQTAVRALLAARLSNEIEVVGGAFTLAGRE